MSKHYVSQPEAASLTVQSSTRSRTRKEVRAILQALLYLAPSLIVFTAFVFYPLARAIFLSVHFTDKAGTPIEFVGLEHYVEMFSKPTFGRTLLITVQFVAYTVIPTILLALILALLANARLKGITLFRALFAATITLSSAVSTLIWSQILRPDTGFLQYLLSPLGIGRILWTADQRYALAAVSIVTVWTAIGFAFLILLGGLQGISEELYEAARIDGAGTWALFQHVTLPLLSPSLFFLAVISIINGLQAFTQINVLTQGGPAGATRTIVYSIYEEAFQNFYFDAASAQSIVLFIIILILTIIQFRVVERRVFYQ